MNCPQCGAIIAEDAKFCGECGFDIADMQLNETNNVAEQSTDALLAEMFPTITETPQKEFTENTEKIEQNNVDRLFLDDDEELNDDDSTEFFSNLVSLNENEEMIDKSSEFFTQSYNREISPVFEEIPDFDNINNVQSTSSENQTFEELESDEDDYSDIVIGDFQQQTLPSQTIDNQIKQNEQTISEAPSEINYIENNVGEENTSEPVNQVNDVEKNIGINENIIMSTTLLTENTDNQSNFNDTNYNLTNIQTINNTVEQTSSTQIENVSSAQSPNSYSNTEPVILIDDGKSTEENNLFNEYNVNVNDKNQTPFLDKFIPHQDANVNFEIPANMEVIEHPIDSEELQQQTVLLNNSDVSQPDLTIEEQPNIPLTQETPDVANTSKKKKSKLPLILTLTITSVLLIGIIVSVFLFKDNISSLFTPNSQQEEIVDVNNNQNDDDNKVQQEELIDNNPNWDLQESSIENPIIVGQASKISKYIDDSKLYSDLQMNLTKIYKGNEALTLAKEYEDNSNVVFETLQEGIEFVVVEYEVYIPIDTNTNGTTANIPLEVRGSSSNGIIFNNSSYIISTWCIEKAEQTTKGQKVICRDIFQMPEGCTDYYLVFGTTGHQTATYKGQ